MLSERDSVLLSGHLNELLIPLLDGCHTVDEIADLLQEKASAAEVYYALMLMEKKGYIAESDDTLPSNLTIFCEHLNVAPILAYRRLQATKVGIKTLGSHLPESEIKTILESMQIQVAEVGDIADIEIVLTDDYLQDDLKTFNEEALRLGRPWMLVKPSGTIVWIGPIFIPRQTGCWQCLAQRLGNNRLVEKYLEKRGDISSPFPPPLGFTSSSWQTALGMAATEIFKWIVLGENELLAGSLITHDVLTLKTQNHTLVKRPQCLSCGEMVAEFNREPSPIILRHQKKTFTADGGHRCLSPEETLRKYQHHISPLTGIVRELRKIPQNSNNLVHTYVARHHFSTIFDDLKVLHHIGGRSAGKGMSDRQAKTSALCEAIERYSGVFQGDEIRCTGSYQQIGDRAIHPNDCMNFSLEQYNQRQEWNRNCSSWFQRIPEPFDEEKEIEWSPVWSLTKQKFKYLPTAYCYHGYGNKQRPDCWADSNGCAAGNTLESAILQGFMELVERDCVALWWYNRLKKPRLDLDSFNEPYFSALKKHYQVSDRELWVLDITSDLKIPAFAAISRRRDWANAQQTDRQVEDIVLGFGAHFDPKIAISRALTEVNQILPNVSSVKADGTTLYPNSSDPLAVKWWKTATLKNQPYLEGDESVPARVATDYPQFKSDDLLEDVINCQKIVEQNGMEMLVLDLTRPDIGLKVVKVIVPGMRHWWRRLGKGRLYEVPVKMDWLEKPLPEHQLNPFPMWM
nr:TOMM precursor leader peptide-binding protein [Pleurocapsa sp. PCC 7319]